MGQEPGYPGCQYNTGLTQKDRQTFTPKATLESTINLTSMCLDPERKPVYPEGTPAGSMRICKLVDSYLGSFCCEGKANQ